MVYSVNDMENVEDAYDTEITDTENVELLKNVGNSDDEEIVESSENVENLEGVEYMESPENVDNMKNLDVENAENMENPMNVENVENIENPVNVESIENMENPMNLGNVETMENPMNVENVEKMGNPVNVDNVENMENPENVDNIENLERVTDVIEESHQENFQGTENNLEVKWPGWPGENVFRMLVPVERVESLIGGEIINKICEETKSNIRILEGPIGTSERTVLVSAKEEPHLPISPAMEGLLEIHKRIVDEDINPANVISGGTVCTRIVVPATQALHLIGKQGSTIKSIEDASNCNISVLEPGVICTGHLPVSAYDCVIEVDGKSSGVHKAVELIVSLLRKFLVDRSVVGMFERQMQKPNACAQNIPPSQHWGTRQELRAAGPGPGYSPSSQYMPPPHPLDTYYPPGETFSMDEQPRQGQFSHGRDHSMGGHVTNMQPHQSKMVTKVTENMQIPLSYADTVIGNAGSHISHIRRSSGATVTVQEKKEAAKEMTLEITGSASEVQAARQLIQFFMMAAAIIAEEYEEF